MRDLGGILIPLGAFTMICWIVYTVVNGARRWYRQRTVGQFQSKLLDRIGSVDELGAFLNTEAGGRFLRGLTTLNESEVGPQVRILRAVQTGAVLHAGNGPLLVRLVDADRAWRGDECDQRAGDNPLRHRRGLSGLRRAVIPAVEAD